MEKIRKSSKLWVVKADDPFLGTIVVGVYSKEDAEKRLRELRQVEDDSLHNGFHYLLTHYWIEE